MGYGHKQMHGARDDPQRHAGRPRPVGNADRLTRVLKLSKPVVRVGYELEEALDGQAGAGQPTLTDLLAPIVAKARAGST
jgi:hypothetical protein